MRFAAGDVELWQTEGQQLHQLSVQRPSAANDELLCIGGMLKHIHDAGACREGGERGLDVGRCGLAEVLQMSLQPCGIEKITPSAFGRGLLQVLFLQKKFKEWSHHLA